MSLSAVEKIEAYTACCGIDYFPLGKYSRACALANPAPKCGRKARVVHAWPWSMTTRIFVSHLPRLLRVACMQPITYPSAETCLADTTHPRIDCLVLDVQLPGVSGRLREKVTQRRKRKGLASVQALCA
jgi:hypothetical protein